LVKVAPSICMAERTAGTYRFFQDGDDLIFAGIDSFSRLLPLAWRAILNGEVTFPMD